MFTGIIQAMGRVEALEPTGGDLRLRLATGELDMARASLGDSIAVNGGRRSAICGWAVRSTWSRH
jgi:riboflavin synthase